MKQYYVYILSNKSRSTLYIGVTSSLAARIEQHRDGIPQNSFTSRYDCKDLIHIEELSTPSEAIAREKQLKKWSRSKKWKLIKLDNPDLVDLSRTI